MRFLKSRWTPSARLRRVPRHSAIDASAFAGILLVLLFLFMAPAFQVQHPKSIPADLAQAENAVAKPAARRDDALIVTITRDGSVYLRSSRVATADLSDSLRDLVQDSAEKTVFIKADARAKYGDINAVVDCIRAAGITDVTFLTESSRP